MIIFFDHFLSKMHNKTTLLRVSLINECITEKVLQFIMPLKPICCKIFCFNEQKCILNTIERLKQQTITVFKSILY